MKLRIASCQLPIDEDIAGNLRIISEQMRYAAGRGADVAHFPETALSGYPGIDFSSFENYDWELLRKCTREIQYLARRLRLWVVLGSSHQLTGNHKPHNSLYIISDSGKIVDRYDKRFCTGEVDKGGDLRFYSPGDHFVKFSIRGIPCSCLICYDFRFQELYRECRKMDVRVMFHSYHNGRIKKAGYSKNHIWGVIVPPTMQAYAANNHFWISATNTSRKESGWAAFFVNPEGRITGRLKRNRTGVLISEIDTRTKFYNAPGAWVHRALRGVLHSGSLVKDKRSADRRCL